MLLVRRSELDWPLVKSPLHYVDMWPMCKSISCLKTTFVYSTVLLIPTRIINDTLHLYSLLHCSHCTLCTQVVSILMGLLGETPRRLLSRRLLSRRLLCQRLLSQRQLSQRILSRRLGSRLWFEVLVSKPIFYATDIQTNTQSHIWRWLHHLKGRKANIFMFNFIL